MLICKIAGNNKAVIENKIVETSTRAGVGDIEKLFIEVLLSEMKNTNNIVNNADTNKIIAVGSPKREIYILPILIVVIDTSKFIINTDI